ncbi:MAG TPA: hypothetical protein VFE89_02640, partial [Beijerinckiaceae bacterium]|nr:hypothetical protein [Beijerinckiaceae bacterium]
GADIFVGQVSARGGAAAGACRVIVRRLIPAHAKGESGCSADNQCSHLVLLFSLDEAGRECAITF